MSKTFGTRKRSNQVHMNVTDPSCRNRNLRNRGLNMLENLTLLTMQTTSGNLWRHPWRVKTKQSTRNQPPGRTNTRVRDVVESNENSAPEKLEVEGGVNW